MEALLSSSVPFGLPPRILTSHHLPFSYEDPAALDGGEKGMDIIEHILALAPRLLKDSGYEWGGSPSASSPTRSPGPAPAVILPPPLPAWATQKCRSGPAQLNWPISPPRRSIFLEVDPRHPELVSSWLQSRPDLSLNLVAVRRDFCGR